MTNNYIKLMHFIDDSILSSSAKPLSKLIVVEWSDILIKSDPMLVIVLKRILKFGRRLGIKVIIISEDFSFDWMSDNLDRVF